MKPAARVVPDVASFSVDDGFWYSIPEHLSNLRVGSIVRVPLSGRRVRGWVLELSPGRVGKLKDVAGISGNLPVFDQQLLDSLLWTARHYVAPVAALLSRATPPNLPRREVSPARVPAVRPGDWALDDIVSRSARGQTSPVTALVANWHQSGWLESLGPVFGSRRSVQVVAASVAEVRTIADRARRSWGPLVASVTGEDDASDTRAWEAAQVPPRIVVGSPRTATWKTSGLGLAIVVEESRRAMKDRQTPTLHVRDVMMKRSRLESFNLVFLGPTPGVELLASGAEILKPNNRAWSLVEIVDRSDEAPGSGFLASRTVAAIAAMAQAGRRTFVFTHRRVGSASLRCTNCRVLRTCSRCGSRLGRVARCPRCGATAGPCLNCGGSEFEEMGTIPERLVSELNRRIPGRLAGLHPDERPITVGTERDLAGLDELDLTVAADVDGMLMGTGYRASEEALRQLARLASVVGKGKGSRIMLQTSHPTSPLISTMRRGDPIPYLERVLVERGREGFPPASEMIAVEVRGQMPDDAGAELHAMAQGSVSILGPMELDDGHRWLLTGRLGDVRLGLREVVGRWRDRGATVRVDVDPIDV